MGNLETLKDEELIALLREDHPEVMEFILEKYKNLVRKKANAMFLIGGDTDDLIQEGMIGLFKAVRDFNQEKDVTFFHFAEVCITRQIYTAVSASQRKKHAPLNSYISIYADTDEENSVKIVDMQANLGDTDPEELLIDQENVEAIYEKMEHCLSNMERKVLSYYLDGRNYREIAVLMDKSPKSIDNALQRIRGKLSDVLDKQI